MHICNAVDIKENRERIEAAPCTVLHAIAKKADQKAKIPRVDIISDEKNSAEGEARKTKVTFQLWAKRETVNELYSTGEED